MKAIELSRKSIKSEKFYAIVDDEDFEYLNTFRWSLTYNKAGNKYATCHDKTKKTKCGKYSAKIKMHRMILKLTDSKILCDHIDGDGLNNQKSNLRIANRTQNARNRSANKNSSSKYIGVSAHTQHGKTKWCARIQKGEKQKYLGIFETQQEAAIAYDNAAKILYGEFAKINIK